MPTLCYSQLDQCRFWFAEKNDARTTHSQRCDHCARARRRRGKPLGQLKDSPGLSSQARCKSCRCCRLLPRIVAEDVQKLLLHFKQAEAT